MNTKQLLLLLLSTVTLQHIDIAACCCYLPKDDPRWNQVMFSCYLANDFYQVCEKNPLLSGKAIDPQDPKSGLEIYDNQSNRTLTIIPDIDEALKLYGFACNADKTILVTFMMDAAQYDKEDELAGLSAKVWNTTNGTCLFTIPRAFAGKFNHKGDKIVVFGGEQKTAVWDINLKKCILKLPCETAYCAEFSKDDREILTHTENSVKVWNATTGKLIK